MPTPVMARAMYKWWRLVANHIRNQPQIWGFGNGKGWSSSHGISAMVDNCCSARMWMNLTIGVYVGTTWGTKGMNRMTRSMKNILPGVYSQGRWLHVCRTCVQSSLSWQHSLDFKALKIARFNISILRWIWIALNCSKLSLHRRISSSPPLIQILFSCFLEWTHSLKLNFLLGSNSSFP